MAVEPTNTWIPFTVVTPEMKKEMYDICAKTWNANTDRFSYKRFVDCSWSYSCDSWLTQCKYPLAGEGYKPMFYMKVELPHLGDTV